METLLQVFCPFKGCPTDCALMESAKIVNRLKGSESLRKKCPRLEMATLLPMCLCAPLSGHRLSNIAFRLYSAIRQTLTPSGFRQSEWL